MLKNNEEFQKIRMCVQTYFNLYGMMPGSRELLEWLGESYRVAVTRYFKGIPAGKLAVCM